MSEYDDKDIVDRLRLAHSLTDGHGCDVSGEAADEIESLRAVVRYCATSFVSDDLQQDVDLDLDPWHSNAVRRAMAADQ